MSCKEPVLRFSQHEGNRTGANRKPTGSFHDTSNRIRTHAYLSCKEPVLYLNPIYNYKGPVLHNNYASIVIQSSFLREPVPTSYRGRVPNRICLSTRSNRIEEPVLSSHMQGGPQSSCKAAKAAGSGNRFLRKPGYKSGSFVDPAHPGTGSCCVFIEISRTPKIGTGSAIDATSKTERTGSRFTRTGSKLHFY